MDVVMALLKQHPGGEAWRGVSIGADLARDALQRRAINNLRSATGIAYREGQIPNQVVPYGIFGGAGKPRALNPQEEAAASLGLSMHEDKDINYAKLIAEERERGEKAKFDRAQAFTSLVAEGGVPYAIGVLKSLGIDPSEFANTPQPPGLTNMMYRQKQIEAENARINAMGGGGAADKRERIAGVSQLFAEAKADIRTDTDLLKQLDELAKNPLYMADPEAMKQLMADRKMINERLTANRERSRGLANWLATNLGVPAELQGTPPPPPGGNGAVQTDADQRLIDELKKLYESNKLGGASSEAGAGASSPPGYGINSIYDWLGSLRSGPGASTEDPLSGGYSSTSPYSVYVPSIEPPLNSGTGWDPLLNYWRNNGPFGPGKYGQGTLPFGLGTY